eukprot:tig00000114_g6057.t1
MTSSVYNATLDVGSNANDFAKISSGSYVDVFIQNPVVIQAVQNAYETPKNYSYQLFFDPGYVTAETIELLHESGLVKRVAPATATAAPLRCLEIKFTESYPTARQYTDAALPGTGAYYHLGNLKGSKLFEKLNPSPSRLGALYTDGNPRASSLPRLPFTFFQFQIYPLSYATDHPHFVTGSTLCAELVECSYSYSFGTGSRHVQPVARVAEVGGDMSIFTMGWLVD